MKPRIIALLTDFGTSDPFVGIMKGVIAEIAPQAICIDITHEIPPGDLQRGAFVLWQAARDFPDGTIFLCVVDPGVGTDRKGIFLQIRDQIFIGPDNGLFSYLLYKEEAVAWELSNPGFQRQGISSTFHGRDIFAPAAAHAARGAGGVHFGEKVPDLITFPKPGLEIEDGSLTGEVISIDQFGNLITSLGLFSQSEDSYRFNSWLSIEDFSIPKTAAIQVKTKHHSFPLINTFGNIPKDKTAGLIGSTGLIEIAANRKSAQRILGLEIGDPVELSWK